jgi:sugar O-acyltransferase (sialic acid O-acetyltransferase NeuD family)
MIWILVDMGTTSSEGQRPLCVVLGSGGHARVLIDAIQAVGKVSLWGILEVDSSKWGQQLLGVAIRGGDNLLATIREQNVTYFVVGLGSTQNNMPRKRLYEQGLSYGLLPLSIIHPSVLCSPNVHISEGCQILTGAIVNAGVKLGNHVIVNSGAIIEHDCEVKTHVHIATGAMLAGGVLVGEEAHVGIGAVVRQGIHIGARAVVGAGAVVVKDVEPETVVVGVPARVLYSDRGS